MGLTRRGPVGAITQVDPGLFKDAQGGFFTGTADNPVYGGTDINAFHLGQGGAAPAAAPSPQSDGRGIPAEAPQERLGILNSNSQGPTERGPVALPTSLVPRVGLPPVAPQPGTSPAEVAQGAAPAAASPPSMAAPEMPKEPTPTAASAPQPFSPLPQSMSPTDAATPGISRRSLTGGPGSPTSSLLGSAGGLLGGGLGVPGSLGGGESNDITAMLSKLLQGRGQGQGY